MEDGENFIKLHNSGGKRWKSIRGPFTEKGDLISPWLNGILGLVIALVALLIAILITTSYTADRVKRSSCDSFRYEVPFVCGINFGAIKRVMPGQYATLIHIHNPNDGEVEFDKKISLSFPPSDQKPGIVSNKSHDSLNSCETLMVDCEEIFINDEFNISKKLPPYIIGMVIVQSPKSSLTIWAEQTVTSTPIKVKRGNGSSDGNIPSLSVYRPEERCVKGGSFFDSFYK